mgnify:CR=1 FL=1
MSANMQSLESYWMPFTANRAFKKNPRLFASAQGMYYETTEGKKVLDGVAGLWCVNAGHGQKKINDAIKFQTHIAEAESSALEPFRVKFSYEDATRFDYWKRMSFTAQQWIEIKQHCDEVGLEFLSSPFSMAAVELLETLGVARYKIGSGEVSNFLMLERIAETGKPIILSSGMSSLDELQATVDFLKPYGNELSLLQCTTSYPTSPENIGLNVILEFILILNYGKE